jgi:glycosyltransferase involved in cell wall biosynthesis
MKVWFRLHWGRDSADTVRVVITSPFFLPFIVAWSRSSRRRAPIVCVLNDLFPDALIYAGMLQPEGWLARLLGGMTRYCFKECEATVFLGSHLMAYAEHSYGKARIGRVIPVGADSTFIRNTPPTALLTEGPICILYAGTMGHMHDIDTLLEVAKRGLPPGFHLTFHSSGVGYARLCGALANPGDTPVDRISLWGPLSDQAWRETLNLHPIGLVTLKEGAQRVSMPSKTYSTLAAGQAILAVCAEDSDLAELIRRHNCGWIVPPGHIEELTSLLVRLARNPGEVHTKRIEAFQVGHSLYDMAAISEQYLDLFSALLKDPRQEHR